MYFIQHNKNVIKFSDRDIYKVILKNNKNMIGSI